jgi:hypothetical protein
MKHLFRLLTLIVITQLASLWASAQTYTTLEFNSPTATNSAEGYSAEATVDGLSNTGWSSAVSGASITWDIDISPNHILPALENNQRYVYEINLSWTSNWRNDLHSYQLSTQTASNTAFSVVTDYESLTSTGGNTLSFNNIITSTQPRPSSRNNVHTLRLAIDEPLESLRLNALTQGWENQPFILAEVSGIAEVMTVPEPSTYALLLGLVACMAVAYKKRINR